MTKQFIPEEKISPGAIIIPDINTNSNKEIPFRPGISERRDRKVQHGNA